MATVTGTAALTAQFECIPLTGFVPLADGFLDPVSGTIKAQGQSTWAALSGSTWGTFTNYIQTFQDIRWTAPVVDLGSVQYFTLNISAEFLGSLKYLIYVSETGLFQGEEQEYCIEDGNYNVPGFYGRYIYVTAIVKGTELISMTIEANSNTVEYVLPNIDSSTLSGTNTNRIVPLPTEVSLIKDMHIQVKAATSYPVNLYVSDTPNSQVLIPVVKSKAGSSPSFALYGIDNDPRDGIVDITVKALPRQAMFGGNLVVLA